MDCRDDVMSESGSKAPGVLEVYARVSAAVHSLNGVISEQEGFCFMALMKCHRSPRWAAAQVRVLGSRSASFCHTPDSKQNECSLVSLTASEVGQGKDYDLHNSLLASRPVSYTMSLELSVRPVRDQWHVACVLRNAKQQHMTQTCPFPAVLISPGRCLGFVNLCRSSIVQQ
ncbi:Uncharacterized protein DAT39_016105 [Clarias magur]|uniref:Uncharacterized protein n=1 Tax=Clarias magur TaxID=1594786 RepID=A0A8J4TF72_CLAMG|nr:Uncharacterized protein DAT39_016105 [Clarias magur]